MTRRYRVFILPPRPPKHRPPTARTRTAFSYSRTIQTRRRAKEREPSISTKVAYRQCDENFRPTDTFLTTAYDSASMLKSAMPGLRIVAVEVPTSVFDEMAKNANWLTSEEALRAIAAGLAAQYGNYAYQIRDTILRQKMDGQRYVLLYGIRQERIALLTLG